MTFEQEVIPYLEGERFSNGLGLKVAKKESSILNRLDYISDLCSGKSVIHLGFADHIPLIPQKIKQNKWLHKRIMDRASKVIGVDIDQEAVDFVEQNYQIGDLHVHDITSPDTLPAITESHWDYMIMGEILEHIDNPVAFLSDIHKNYSKHIDRMIITVPNAFDLTNLLASLQNKELINTDHRYWFTPYTVAKVASRAGFEVEEFMFCQSYKEGSFWKRWMMKRYPIMRASVVMVIKAN